MKIAEKALEKRLQDKINSNELHFGYMPGKGTVDALFMSKNFEKRFKGKRKARTCVLLIKIKSF